MADADEYRRKAEHFLMLAQHLSRLEDRAVIISMAAYWMERAEEVERSKTQPDKEPEGERS